MARLNSHEIAQRIGARAIGSPADAIFVVADSRTVGGDTAFAAVRGGHAFVAEALAAGAPFAIVQDVSVVPSEATAIVVDDVVTALGAIAKHVTSASSVPVVGITGSTGKTLTKDFVAAALGASYDVHATPRSYNAEIGVPLTVLGMPPTSTMLVAEVAARHPHDIAYLCDILHPRTGVITGIGIAHLDVFGSRTSIATTKAELFAALPADGLAIAPSSDDFLDLLARSTNARMRTVGPGGHIRYRAHEIRSDGRTFGEVAIGRRRVPVVLPVPGRALMRNAALAIAVAIEHNVDAEQAAAAIADATLSGSRVQIVHIGSRTIVDDAWNANPTSVRSTLRSAKELAGSRDAWAVLGEMAELGPTTQAEHYRAGALAAFFGYRGVIAVGERAAPVAEGFASAGDSAAAHRVESLDAAEAAVRRLTAADAVVVVKASRVAGLERLVELLEAPNHEIGERNP